MSRKESPKAGVPRSGKKRTRSLKAGAVSGFPGEGSIQRDLVRVAAILAAVLLCSEFGVLIPAALFRAHRAGEMVPVAIPLFAGIGGLLVIGILMWGIRLCLKHIVVPMTQISGTLASIAEGAYDVPVSIEDARGEVQHLGEGIHHLAEKLAFAERAKLEFISTVSHELRTPLTAIKGWSETLLQEPADSDITRRGLSVMIEESQRLTHLVEELLDFSQIQSRRLQLEKEPMDVLAELDDVLFFFRERAARDGVTLHSTTADYPAPMLGDPARIRQVFINLLDNALKYTPQGGQVSVRSEFRPELLHNTQPLKQPERLIVTIEDSGSGVSTEDLPHITEKFFKSSSTRGSGIGLAVVDELLKEHDCRLRFESPPGKGLTVRIEFPLSYILK